MYSGKFTNENRSPKGEFTSEKKLNCTIEKVDGFDGLNVKTERINALSGFFSTMTSFGSLVKKLSVRYTFLGYIRKILVLKRTSRLAEHPAEEMDVDNSIKADVDALLTGNEASETVINSPIYFQTKARLVSYFRAPINFVRKLVFERVTKLLSCEGKLARSIRTMMVTRASKATKGEGVLARSKENTFYTSKEAKAESAPSTVRTLEHIISNATYEAKTISIGSADGVIDSNLTFTHEANLAFWFYPEIVGDGELVLKQAYSATQNDYELGVT